MRIMVAASIYTGLLAFRTRTQVWHFVVPCFRYLSEKTSFGSPQPGQGICIGQILVLTFLLRFPSREMEALATLLLCDAEWQLRHFQAPLSGLWSTRTGLSQSSQRKAL